MKIYILEYEEVDWCSPTRVMEWINRPSADQVHESIGRFCEKDYSEKHYQQLMDWGYSHTSFGEYILDVYNVEEYGTGEE